jgi:hypothetical protein
VIAACLCGARYFESVLVVTPGYTADQDCHHRPPTSATKTTKLEMGNEGHFAPGYDGRAASMLRYVMQEEGSTERAPCPRAVRLADRQKLRAQSEMWLTSQLIEHELWHIGKCILQQRF